MTPDSRRLAVLGVCLTLLACNHRKYPTRESLLPDGGSFSVSGRFEGCPRAFVDVAPTNVRFDDLARVSAFRSVDPDGDVLTYQWSATSGRFVEPRAGETYFKCAEPGPVTLTLAVTDGTCDEKATAAIFCLGASDAGTMPAPVDPGVPVTPGKDGGAGGTGGVASTCPKEQGDEACNACTATNCSLGETGTDGCCGIYDPVKRKTCDSVYACFAANGCTSSGDPTGCFCGTSGALCFQVAGKANGPCVAQVLAASETDDPATVLDRFGGSIFALSRATNLSNCRGAFCAAECGIQ